MFTKYRIGGNAANMNMKAVFNYHIDSTNWTFGKEYEVKPSFVSGFASIIDDDGAEHLVRYGSKAFLWKE